MTAALNSPDKQATVLAVTGGLGSGKSTAVRFLAELGAKVFSADEIARQVVVPPSAVLTDIVARFGAEVLAPDGTLNRKSLGKLVFSNSTARRDLEAIMHPAIRRAFSAEVAKLTSTETGLLVVYEAPLLFEAGTLPQEVRSTLLIAAPDELCIERALARDGLSREEVLARMAAQLPMAEKRLRAEYVIENDSDIESLRVNVVEFYRKFRGGTNDGCIV